MSVSNAGNQQLLSYLQSAGIDSITDLYADITDIASNRRNSYNIYNDYNSLNTTSNFICKMTMETYRSNPNTYLYDTQFGDFVLYANFINDCNTLIYKTVDPLNNNTKRVVIAIRGSQTLYDYMVDLDILKDYSSNTEGVEDFVHLYTRFLDDVYDKIVEIINAEQDENNNTRFYISAHSLGAKAAMDAFNRLITNNLNAGVSCYIYNPFTVNDVYAEDLLNNIDLALLGNESHLKYFALRTDIHAHITQGDYISALYLNFFPGNVSVYPSISTVQNYLPSLLNVGYNAILGNNNHALSNFTNKTDADVELSMRAEYYYDENDQVFIPIHLSYARIINEQTKDLTSIAGTLSNNAHLHLKAISDTQQFMNLIVMEDDDDHMKYLWEFRKEGFLFRTYFIGNEKIITPVYKITNHEYTNNYHYVYVEETGVNQFNIIRVNSNGTIPSTQQCVLTQKSYTPIELSNKRDTGITLDFTDKASLVSLTQPDAISRRQWTLTFGESSSVVPIQDEAQWHDQDDLRRVINKDLFTHSSITSTDGITIRFDYYSQTGNLDSYNVPFYLYDIGGVLKWGHLNIGGIDNYKIILEHTNNDLYDVKINTWTNTSYTPSYEIIHYDTNRYLIRNTDTINSGMYLKKPTFDQWQYLQDYTIIMIRDNTVIHFRDIVWDSWDGITGSPDDFLFTIEPFSNIQIPPSLGDSLTNNVNGVATETWFMYPQYIRSTNENYVLMMERNGNLIIWQKNNGAPWMANTHDDGNALLLQSDGNLVVYGYGTQFDTGDPVRWASGTGGGDGIRTIRISDDGKFQIYDGSNNLMAQFP